MKFLPMLLLLAVKVLSTAAGAAPGSPQVLRVGIHTFPETLNPVYSTRETSQAIMNKIYDSLYCYDATGKIINCLAAGAELYKGGEGIVIRLKEGVLFSDGKELSAEDVIQTVMLMKDPAFAYPYMSGLKFIKEIEGVDRYRFRLILEGTVAAWKKRLTFKVLNSRQLKNAVPATFRRQVLSGTGPYRIKNVHRPAAIELELQDFFRRRGKTVAHGKMYRRIRYDVISYTELGPMKLVANELDICELQPNHIKAYSANRDWRRSFRIFKYRKFGYTYLVFNQKNKTIDNAVKNIFYHLLIAGDFSDRFLEGNGHRINTPFLLLNDKLKPVVTDGETLKKSVRLKILTNNESKLRRNLVLFLKKELKPFNIILEPQFMEYQSFLDYLKKSRYDIAISGYLFHIDNDLRDILRSDSYFNYAGYRSAEMDSLLDRGAAETDPLEREALYLKAHELWLKDLPLIPLFSLYYYVGVSRKIPVPAQTYSIISAEGDFLFNISQWVAGAN